MKNQYFGDVNDYRKYGLLRILSSVARIPVGVCWLLTADDGRSDGELRRYLQDPSHWRAYDPELYDNLRALLNPGVARSVTNASTWQLLPGATYYERLLVDDLHRRREYFDGAWEELRSCPIMFFDPDNGIQVSSKRLGAKDSAKYIFWHELEHAYSLGHSLVIYQHFARVARDAYTAGLAKQLAERLQAPVVDSFRTAHVVFFLTARPEHVSAFELAHTAIDARWGRQIHASAHVAS